MEEWRKFACVGVSVFSVLAILVGLYFIPQYFQGTALSSADYITGGIIGFSLAVVIVWAISMVALNTEEWHI